MVDVYPERRKSRYVVPFDAGQQSMHLLGTEISRRADMLGYFKKIDLEYDQKSKEK